MLIAMLWIVWLHFLADFVLQSDKVSKAKSGSNRVLAFHVALYSVPFIPFAAAYMTPANAATWLLVNVAAHFVTDYITSRMTSKLWKAGDVHNFFVVIGADQAIHMTTLFLTFAWLSQ